MEEESVIQGKILWILTFFDSEMKQMSFRETFCCAEYDFRNMRFSIFWRLIVIFIFRYGKILCDIKEYTKLA
mgnify:FL=1